jgi:hypothetical protein
MKICPDCQSRYDDDVDQCPKDGEELVDLPDELSENPRLPEPQAAAPADRTSMIDLEAIEAKRRKKPAADEGGEGDGDEADDKTPPPEEPIEEDRDATGTLHRTKRGKRKEPTKVSQAPIDDEVGPDDGGDADEDFPEDRRVNEELTDREMSRSRSRRSRVEATGVGRGTRTGMTRAGTRAGTQAGTRAGTRMAARPKRMISPMQAALIAAVVLIGVIGGIIFVARATAVVTVTTVPPGASVSLDGKLLGNSPVQKRVTTGEHLIELSLDGYEPFKEVVSVPTGGLPFLQPLQKKPPPPPPPPTPAQIADDLVKAAQELFDAGDLDLAKKKLDEALQLVPEHAGAKRLLPKVEAAIAEKAKKAANAAAAAEREARLRQARVLAEEGQRLYNAGQLGPAREKLYASLKLDADNPEPHRTLGRIFNREDQVDKVRYHLQRYLDLGGADGDFKVREWLKTHPK